MVSLILASDWFIISYELRNKSVSFRTKVLILQLSIKANIITGYQIRSRHFLLKMVSVTKSEENQSFDNVNSLLITSTSVVIFSCIMEVLMYFLYNNKVSSESLNILPISDEF